MPITRILREFDKFELQAYKKPDNLKDFRKKHVPFSGAPLNHPFDRQKIILVADPYSSSTFYYEFRLEDICFAEELPNIVNLDGVVIAMARVWVKKKSVGMRCTPFIVDETSYGKTF